VSTVFIFFSEIITAKPTVVVPGSIPRIIDINYERVVGAIYFFVSIIFPAISSHT